MVLDIYSPYGFNVEPDEIPADADEFQIDLYFN